MAPSFPSVRRGHDSIEEHRKHGKIFYVGCRYCQIEWSMYLRLTSQAYHDWMTREDHEECLTAFND